MKPQQIEQPKGGMLSSIQFFNALNKYIPSLVLQNWIDKNQAEYLEQEQYKRQLSKTDKIPIDPPKKAQLPYIQDMETVVLFADISGFTNISEACAQQGIRGNEQLAFCINRYMEGMVKNLAKFGGDIIKFIGDAMIVMWPRTKWNPDDPENNDDDEKVQVIRKAIQCAMDIQKELNNKKIMANVSNLSVKIGIGFGKCAILYVGGVFDRSEFFTVGGALTNALASEEQATGGGQIIVSDSAFKFVKNQFYEGEEIISAAKKKFYRVTKVITGVRGRADAVLLKSQMKVDRMTGIQKSLKSCVPAAIMPYLEIGYENFGSETRALTVMFASLGVDLSSASSKEGMAKIQKVVTTVQQQVYRLEGSLNKLVMDDKGSTLICIWGLCPMAHKDDPQRAIMTAMNMRRELKKIEGTWCNVGIATGDVFSGVVGTSGSRKEFSVLGDTVNLAARIMFWPLKFGLHGKINCDLRTKNESMNQITFKYGEHCEFKGKSISIPIFEPIDPNEEFMVHEGSHSGFVNRIIQPQCFLKLSYNPIRVQKQVNHKKYLEPLIGRQNFLNDIYDVIKGFLFNKSPNVDDIDPLVILLQGETGTGKTHLARALCEKIQKDNDFIRERQIMDSNKPINKPNASNILMGNTQQGRQFPLFASTVNCETRMKFLGAWRPILRNMLEYRRRMQDVSRGEILRDLLMHHQDKIDIVLNIFGITTGLEEDILRDRQQTEKYFSGNISEPQIEDVTKQSPFHFLTGDQYNNSSTDQVLDLMLYFIKDFLGENLESEFSSESFNDESASSRTSNRIAEDINKVIINKKNQFNKATPRSQKPAQSNSCILIFDNTSLMDNESWCLLMRVFQSCQNLVIICLADIDFKGNPVLPSFEKTGFSSNKSNVSMDLPYYQNEIPVVQIFMDNLHVYDIPPLSGGELRHMLIEMAPEYQSSYKEEVRLMTEIKNPAKTIKSKEKCDEWVKVFTKQFNLERVYVDVDDRIIKLILQKCDGNALVCLQYFFNLISVGYIEVNLKGVMVPKKNLEASILLQNFTKIPVPSSIHKRRLKNMDTFLKKGRSKNNIRKQELAVKGLMLMKAASIIGDEFGTSSLKKILPLRQETHSSMLIILKELEQEELIEILDETDPKNIHCRFNKSFLRESIYQIMLFKDQKKILHQQLAEHMQSLPSSIMDQRMVDIEIQKIKEHILIGEDVKNEDELPFKQKYGIIVKQMQSLLITNNHKMVLYRSIVLKQGKKASKKISKRLLILTPKELQWFHNTKEYENNSPPLGIIKVEDIYNCSETRLLSNTFDFEIAVTQYIRKGILDSTPRNIKFGCDNENDRHHWISRIEFLKAKNVYENYVNKFVNIQFPLKKEEDLDEDDQEQQKDMIYEKLHQFGKNFKQNVKINHQTVQMQTVTNRFKKQQTSLGGHHQLRQTGLKSMIARQSVTSSTLRQSSFDMANNDYQMQIQQNIQSAKELSKKIGQIYNCAMLCTVNQMTLNANKSHSHSNFRNKKLGKLPDFYLPEWMSESPIKSTRSGGSFAGKMNELDIEKNKLDINRHANERDTLQLKFKFTSGKNEEQQHHSGVSARTPTPDQMKKIEEQSEGSSSQNNNNRREKFRKGNGPRMSEHIPIDRHKEILNELGIPHDERNTNNDRKEHQANSQVDKTSANSVTNQLQMIEESKTQNDTSKIAKPPIPQNVNFTSSMNQINQQQLSNQLGIDQSNNSRAGNGHYRAQSYGLDSSINPNTSSRSQMRSDINYTPGHDMNAQILSQFHHQSDPYQNQVQLGNQFSDPQHPIMQSENSSGQLQPNLRQDARPLHQHLSPLIQQEITNQINEGFKEFFINLDRRLEEQSKKSSQVQEPWSLNQSQSQKFFPTQQPYPLFNEQQHQMSAQPMLQQSMSQGRLGNMSQQQQNWMRPGISGTPQQPIANFMQPPMKPFIMPPFQHTQNMFNPGGVGGRQRQIIDSIPQSKQTSENGDDDEEPLDPDTDFKFQKR